MPRTKITDWAMRTWHFPRLAARRISTKSAAAFLYEAWHYAFSRSTFKHVVSQRIEAGAVFTTMTAILSPGVRGNLMRLCVFAAVAIGISGIVGWALNIDGLKSLSP